MVEVKLFGGFRRYARGGRGVMMQVLNIKDVLRGLPVERGEVGLVLVNKQPVDLALSNNYPLNDGDVVEIYPIVSGG